jgi:hypothetical protein
MVLLPDHARQRNNFKIIPLARPLIERAVDCDGFYVLRGDRGWLFGDRRDAMDPDDLRDCIQKAIIELIEPVAWKRCEVVNRAGQESLRRILQKWKGAR